jgi:hypothetical protein
MGQTHHSTPAQVNYTSSPHPSQVQQQQHQMMATGQRPGILGSPPQGLMQQRPQHQGEIIFAKLKLLIFRFYNKHNRKL